MKYAALKHGVTNDVRLLWEKTAEEVSGCLNTSLFGQKMKICDTNAVNMFYVYALF